MSITYFSKEYRSVTDPFKDEKKDLLGLRQLLYGTVSKNRKYRGKSKYIYYNDNRVLSYSERMGFLKQKEIYLNIILHNR
ncbi:hypothetical protein D7X25_29910 [bacterium 1XD42-8]|nr:hypothetical protein D7X25_29910 [bacterium 1XD42-8]